MADNPGVYPLDPATEVGQIRLLVGDTQSVAYDPPQTGVQSYETFSDAEIEAFLSAADGSFEDAVAYAYLSLAGRASAESETVKDYDLTVDLTKKATDYRNLAEVWFSRGLDSKETSAEDAFEVVPTGRRQSHVKPELAPWSFR